MGLQFEVLCSVCTSSKKIFEQRYGRSFILLLPSFAFLNNRPHTVTVCSRKSQHKNKIPASGCQLQYLSNPLNVWSDLICNWCHFAHEKPSLYSYIRLGISAKVQLDPSLLCLSIESKQATRISDFLAVSSLNMVFWTEKITIIHC